MDLADQMINSKLFPTDHVYESLFQFSEDKYTEMRDLVREDAKRVFRNSQIENEGNDPVLSGVSFGTPHDLASMYGRRTAEGSKVPLGYDEEENEPGRPREKASIIGTQDDPLGGRDRLGQKDMKGGYPSDNNNVNEEPMLSKTRAIYLQNQDMFKKSTLLSEQDKHQDKLLDESNIKDLDK